ncbi:MAG: hypothetical protein HN417_02425 [Desulfobacula sp.]|nr:hypothetical protein [Desulfobacula sp.]MBT6340952.1 hypothetical protein [Desulfobacula sp.]
MTDPLKINLHHLPGTHSTRIFYSYPNIMVSNALMGVVKVLAIDQKK